MRTFTMVYGLHGGKEFRLKHGSSQVRTPDLTGFCVPSSLDIGVWV